MESVRELREGIDFVVCEYDGEIISRGERAVRYREGYYCLKGCLESAGFEVHGGVGMLMEAEVVVIGHEDDLAIAA